MLPARNRGCFQLLFRKGRLPYKASYVSSLLPPPVPFTPPVVAAPVLLLDRVGYCTNDNSTSCQLSTLGRLPHFCLNSFQTWLSRIIKIPFAFRLVSWKKRFGLDREEMGFAFTSDSSFNPLLFTQSLLLLYKILAFIFRKGGYTLQTVLPVHHIIIIRTIFGDFFTAGDGIQDF